MSQSHPQDDLRTRPANVRPPRSDGRWVVYWMTAARRARWNFGLQRAVAWARAVHRPLLVVETLACGHPWASRRHHQFVLEGMAENARQLADRPVRYYPFVERTPHEARELVAALGQAACLVVADDFPIRRFQEDLAAVAGRATVRVEAVDGNGLLPLGAADRVFPTAFTFRRFLQKVLRDYLLDVPQPDPLARVKLPGPAALPREILSRWPAAPARWLADPSSLPRDLPIDQGVEGVETRGGPNAARETLRQFVRHNLARYAELRNHPDEEVTSGLAPYLHFGHISVHEVFREVARAEHWSPAAISEKTTGQRDGWWGVSESAEGFLDQLITWRELGLNMSSQRGDYDRWESLPDWARATLDKHARDARAYVYSLAELEAAATHDRLWNAAQRQLVREGRMHNYLRMLWGKKIVEWSPSPQEALELMIELNNKWALDGEDPNSYSGILWVLGRYDRPWAPQRPIFGAVRYMTSQSAQRKLRLRRFLEEYGDT